MSIDLDSTLFLWRAPLLNCALAQGAGRLALLRACGGGRSWSAMALARILSVCSALLVVRQVFAESGDLEQLEQPLEPERGELQGIQVQVVLQCG